MDGPIPNHVDHVDLPNDTKGKKEIGLVQVLLQECLEVDFEELLDTSDQSRQVLTLQLELLTRLIIHENINKRKEKLMQLIVKIVNESPFIKDVPFFNLLLKSVIQIVKMLANDEQCRSTLLQNFRKFVHFLAGLKLTSQAALEDSAKLTGELIGVLFRADIEAGDRALAEAFLGELGSLLPSDPDNSDTCTSSLGDHHLLCPTVVPLYGTLAVTCQDDAITDLCMNALMTQFDKGAYGKRTRLFFDQFNLLASGTSVLSFNKSIDIYTRMYLDYERDDYLLGEVAKGLVGLVSLCTRDKNKLEVLVVSLMQGFVNKGLHILPEYALKEPPRVLEYLLAPISLALENVQTIDNLPRSTLVEIFQEFWFILIYFGYQPNLKWSEGWRKHIAIIAYATPVLIKEIRSASDRVITQSLLSKNVNPQLKAHLITFMPNCVQKTGALSTAHCLWLLSYYHSEAFKLAIGQFHGLFRYLESEAVEKLALFPFVDDIAVTLIQQWIHQNNRPDLLLSLSLEIVHNVGHQERRVHGVAMNLIRYIIERDDMVLSEREFWLDLVQKIHHMKCNTETPLEELAFTETFIQDPQYGEVAFEDMKMLVTNCASKCYIAYPVMMHLHMKFLLERYPNINFKLFLASLIQTCRPGQSLTLQSVNDIVVDLTDDFLQVQDFTLKEAGRIILLLTKSPGAVEKFLPMLIAKMKVVFAKFHPCRSPVKERVDFGPTIEKAREITQVEDRLKFFLVLTQFLNTLILRRAHLNVPFGRELGNALVELCDCFNVVVSIRPLYIIPLIATWGLTNLSVQNIIPLEEFDRQRLTIATYQLLTFYFEQASVYELFSDDVLTGLSDQCGHLTSLLEQNSNFLRLQTLKRTTLSESRLIKLNSVLLVMARHEHQKVSILSGTYEQVESLGFQRMQYDMALDINPMLGYRFYERFLAHEPFYPTKILNEEHSLALLQSSDIIDALMDDSSSSTAINSTGENVILPARLLMMAPPLAPISALQVFRKFSRQPLWLNYAMRSLEWYPPPLLFFYTPQLVQTVRCSDRLGFIQSTIMHIASCSPLFAHQVIWNCQANLLSNITPEGTTTKSNEHVTSPSTVGADQILLGLQKDIVATMGPHELNYYQREFSFFSQITGISGTLKPFIKREKWEKKQKIDEELRKISISSEDFLYLPSNPESQVVGIDYESGRPLQSAAKAPFMATFKVRPHNTDNNNNGNNNGDQDHESVHGEDDHEESWQSSIFKVGDDCRQDVMTLQLISMFKEIWQHCRVPLYVYPYRVVATAPGCGVIEVIPKALSRDQLGRERVNNLHLYFLERHKTDSTAEYALARLNFVKSLSAYSLITFLVAIRDRHNGNIMIHDDGYILHIDFGFIMDLSPGGITFEKSPFKLTAEMIAVLGGQQQPWFLLFKRLLLQGFLAVRQQWRHLIRLASLMDQARLPCFDNFPNRANLMWFKNRFELTRSDADLVALVDTLVYKSTENIRTVMYDSYQLSRNGIPY